MIGGWILEENLRSFLEALSAFSGYELGEDDWVAVEYGLLRRAPDANADSGAIELRYPLQGERPIDLSLSFEPGSGVVSFELRADPDLEARGDAIAFVAASYVLEPRSAPPGRKPIGDRRLRVVELGVHLDLDRDRSADIRASEVSDAVEWVDTFDAIAAGREVFVTARFFVVYAGRKHTTFGGAHQWHTLSTQRDVTDDLVRLASDVHLDDWTTEIVDQRMAGYDIEPADYQPAEATIRVSAPLAERLALSTETAAQPRPRWRLAVERP